MVGSAERDCRGQAGSFASSAKPGLALVVAPEI
jgi:hypothetical protein